MKPLFYLFLLFSFACDNSAMYMENEDDYFHGEITYRYTYQSDQLDSDSLTQVRPHTGKMLFEAQNYRSVFIGSDTSRYIYLGDVNLCYGYYSQDQTEECEDYSMYTDSILDFKVYESDTTILGLDCFVLEFQSKYFWNRYYVSETIHLNPLSYEDHHAYNWSFYGKECKGGLILAMEHRFNKFTMKGRAINIEHIENEKKLINTQRALSLCAP